jgi:hypothetical protein
MDLAPGPSSSTLALTALSLDPAISRIVNCLEDSEDCDNLPSVSTDLRDACDRQVKELSLPSQTCNVVKALSCLPRMMQQRLQLLELDLRSLTAPRDMEDEELEAPRDMEDEELEALL